MIVIVSIIIMNISKQPAHCRNIPHKPPMLWLIPPKLAFTTKVTHDFVHCYCYYKYHLQVNNTTKGESKTTYLCKWRGQRNKNINILIWDKEVWLRFGVSKLNITSKHNTVSARFKDERFQCIPYILGITNIKIQTYHKQVSSLSATDLVKRFNQNESTVSSNEYIKKKHYQDGWSSQEPFFSTTALSRSLTAMSTL